MANQIVITVTIVERNPRRLWFPKAARGRSPGKAAHFMDPLYDDSLP
jgi:hypothetical protein